MRNRVITILELALLSPAALFMLAIILRSFSRLPFEVRSLAEQVVAWYAGRLWTLWVFLVTLPMIVLVSGAAILWYKRPDLLPGSRGLLRATTITAGGILAVVVLHILAN